MFLQLVTVAILPFISFKHVFIPIVYVNNMHSNVQVDHTQYIKYMIKISEHKNKKYRFSNEILNQLQI